MSSLYKKRYQGDPKIFGKTAVLLGGESAEREISLKSGGAIVEALVEKGVEVIAMDAREKWFDAIQRERVERVFIALHGPGGEDGKVQAILETLNIPYTGSGHAASALAMDKRKTKLIWQALGIPTPNSLSLSRESNWAECLQTLGGEVFVKPAHEGSSIGMSCVSSAEALEQAFARAVKYDKQVLAEQRIHGQEFTVSILGEQVLPAVELLPKNAFYDFDAKYVSDETEYRCPAALPESRKAELDTLVMAAFRGLGCSGWGRVDLMFSKRGEFNLLEVNTVPGMTSHSLVPMAAKAVGLNFDELVLEILCQTLA